MATNSVNRRPSGGSHTASAKRLGGAGAYLAGSVVLGICMLISGLNIGSNIKKLNETITEKEFASDYSFAAPSELTYSNKSYLTEEEAAAYLNLTSAKIIQLINAGEIDEFIRTETGYCISVKELDAWFDNAAYQTKLNLSGGAPEPEDDPEE